MQLRRTDLEKSPSKGALQSQASGGAPQASPGFLPQIDPSKKIPDWAVELSPRQVREANSLSRNPQRHSLLRKGSNNYASGVGGVAGNSSFARIPEQLEGRSVGRTPDLAHTPLEMFARN